VKFAGLPSHQTICFLAPNEPRSYFRRFLRSRGRLREIADKAKELEPADEHKKFNRA